MKKHKKIKTMTEKEFKQKCKYDCEYCDNDIKSRCPLMPKSYLKTFVRDLIKGGINV